MNVLLWYMKQYYIAECEPGSFHAKVVKDLYYLAKDYGNDEHRHELGSTGKLAQLFCRWVYEENGVPFWWYWFFCILIDAESENMGLRDTLLVMTPDQLNSYFEKLEVKDVQEN